MISKIVVVFLFFVFCFVLTIASQSFTILHQATRFFPLISHVRPDSAIKPSPSTVDDSCGVRFAAYSFAPQPGVSGSPAKTVETWHPCSAGVFAMNLTIKQISMTTKEEERNYFSGCRPAPTALSMVPETFYYAYTKKARAKLCRRNGNQADDERPQTW